MVCLAQAAWYTQAWVTIFQVLRGKVRPSTNYLLQVDGLVDLQVKMKVVACSPFTLQGGALARLIYPPGIPLLGLF